MVIRKRGNTNQLTKNWEEYIQDFKMFLQHTKIAGAHENAEVADKPSACMKSKELMKWIGGSEARMMFKHVGEVEAKGNWQETLYKISRGILRYSFMQKLPDGRKHYAEWYSRYITYQVDWVDQVER